MWQWLFAIYISIQCKKLKIVCLLSEKTRIVFTKLAFYYVISMKSKLKTMQDLTVWKTRTNSNFVKKAAKQKIQYSILFKNVQNSIVYLKNNAVALQCVLVYFLNNINMLSIFFLILLKSRVFMYDFYLIHRILFYL